MQLSNFLSEIIVPSEPTLTQGQDAVPSDSKAVKVSDVPTHLIIELNSIKSDNVIFFNQKKIISSEYKGKSYTVDLPF